MVYRLATRGSLLAKWQANFVKEGLEAERIATKLVTITTTGDRDQRSHLQAIGGKGVFVKEIERAMLEGRADLAVHSLKDLPAKLVHPFSLPAVLKRHSARDLLILRSDLNPSLPKLLTANELARLSKMRIGTASPRRQALLAKYPQLICVPIRGNVDTRIKKLESGALEGIILAEAAIERLGLGNKVNAFALSPSDFVPCAAQGAIAIESMTDSTLNRSLNKLNCPTSSRMVSIEREVLYLLKGDCTLPVGVYCEACSSHIRAHAFLLHNGRSQRCSLNLPLHSSIEESAAAIYNRLVS